MKDDSPHIETPQGDKQEGKSTGQHRMSSWLRIPLKISGWLIAVVLALVIIIPIALYIPPVQTFVKDVACKVVKEKTGMEIGIEEFRLKFPLDVSLKGVDVIEAKGDTMVSAREVIADVKFLPLLKLDVQVNKLSLLDGYYRMVSPDSSMIMKLRAGLLDVTPGANVNIKRSEILLKEASLKDGDVQLYMDVWKKKPTPVDTTATPFYIKADKLKIDNIRFGMSMLPTIDTLRLETAKLALDNAIIDLRSNSITAGNLWLEKGGFRYISPTAEYIASHPAPVDTVSPPSAPMKISAAKITLRDFGGVYAIKGARPVPGFDPSYIEVKDVGIVLKDFYNEASTIILPIDSLTATERCGLNITSGSGTFSMDSIGMSLKELNIRTPYSTIQATAEVPFALMSLQPDASVKAQANISMGMRDIQSFMPSLSGLLRQLPGRQPLVLEAQAAGTLSSIDIPRLNASMKGVFNMRAKGYAQNALNLKKLRGYIDINGEVVSPGTIEKIAGLKGFELPKFKIKGKATANQSAYTADMALLTPKGDVVAKGGVNLSSERYDADVKVHDLVLSEFLPSTGIGKVDLGLRAHGAGFNPTLPHAATDVDLDVRKIVFKGTPLTDIVVHATLHDGEYELSGVSPNSNINFDIALAGHLAPDNYSTRGYVHLRNADLQALGISDDINSGSADFYIDANASPNRWIYRADLKIENFDWNLPDQYIHLPNGMTAMIDAGEQSVECHVYSKLTSLDFESSENLKKVIDSFSAVSGEVMTQIDHREIMMDKIQSKLPPFTLRFNASGQGVANQFLTAAGLSLDTVYAELRNDSLFSGDVTLHKIGNATLTADTLTLALQQRESLLDYKVHMGNTPGTLDEFAKVDLNGYIGSNRISAYLKQQNLSGETGYRIGLTAAMMDSTVSVHLTPLKATIAYLPWTINADNYVDLDLKTFAIDANFEATSRESGILIRTEPSDMGENSLHLKLTNIHIQDFLNMVVNAPPVTASINSDIMIHYDDHELQGKGSLGITDFTYDKMRVGDFDLGLQAGLDFNGDSDISLGLKVDNTPDALTLHTILNKEDFMPKSINVNLNEFPLSIANAFLGKDIVSLKGSLNGKMDLNGNLTKPLLNGDISCNEVSVYIPMIGSSLKFDSEPIVVADNILRFNNFDIYGANKNPLTIDGTVNAEKFSAVSFNLTAIGNNFQAINNDRRARSDLFGKLFFDLDASVRGPMQHFDINANVNILSATDISYTIPASTGAQLTEGMDNVVKFVNFNDTVTTAEKKEPQLMNMRINAGLTLSPGMQATVFLSTNGTDKVTVSPSGTLNYFQNYMGDMRLNGQLYIGEGFAQYSIPLIGQKKFEFDPQSNILWNGDIMNPILNVHATDVVKANVVEDGNSRLVDFNVVVNATGQLAHPNLGFDLNTGDDLSIQNQLQSMSSDQRMQQAMNLLLTGQYSGQGVKTSAGPLTGNVYSFLAGQLNSWAAQNIRGVDLSFGVDQYDRAVNGESSTTTSYSYQVSKSLFNNRFKINVGGNYSTDASADENLTQNLLSDVSFEYMIRQTPTQSMYVRLFRHTGFESILEGEITETGVGFVMKRRLQNLRSLFRFGKKKRKSDTDKDTIKPVFRMVTTQSQDSTATGKKGGEE